MQQFRGYEFSAAELSRVTASQQPVILTVGRSKVGQLYVLPMPSWGDTFRAAFGFGAEDESGLCRVTTRTAKNDGLDEGMLLGVLMGQVDEHGVMAGDACVIVTLGGDDAAYLVPASRYWQERVEGDK